MESSFPKSFFTFRFSDTKSLEDSDIMEMVPQERPIPEEVGLCIANGLPQGTSSRVIFSGFGISVVHVWFKRSFPLPLHSHDADCVYYILAGGLRLGTEDFGPGDGFFVPADVPYTYRPGSDGVELLEIRNRDRFDYRDRSTSAFWKKALKVVQENRENWAAAPRLMPFTE